MGLIPARAPPLTSSGSSRQCYHLLPLQPFRTAPTKMGCWVMLADAGMLQTFMIDLIYLTNPHDMWRPPHHWNPPVSHMSHVFHSLEKAIQVCLDSENRTYWFIEETQSWIYGRFPVDLMANRLERSIPQVSPVPWQQAFNLEMTLITATCGM